MRIQRTGWIVAGMVLFLAGTAPCKGLSPASSYVRTVPAALSMTDPQFDPAINWPTFHGVQQTGKVEASFNCFGQFGIRYSPFISSVPEWPSSGFVAPPITGPEYLYGGAIWIGGIVGEDTLVSTGVRGRSFGPELHPPGFSTRSREGSVTKFEYISDCAMRAEFSDTIHAGVTYQPDFFGHPHRPLNVKIANRSHIWRNRSLADFVIYDLVITNIGSEEIRRGYVGVYFDADIGYPTGASHSDDVAGSIRELGLGYMIDNDGDPVSDELVDGVSVTGIFAAKYLRTSFAATDTSFNWWENRIVGSFGPRLRSDIRDFQTGWTGSPDGDVNAYHVMSSGEWDYNQVMTGTIGPVDPVWQEPSTFASHYVSNGADSRFLLSIGPFDLLPDSSVRVLLTTANADSVIARADLLQFINLVPELHDDVINLDYLQAAISPCDSLVECLLDPLNPATGLSVQYRDTDSVVIEWDPWVFEDVEGYEVYLSEIPPSVLPYPGLIPPWYQPKTFRPVASLGRTSRFALTDLDADKLYSANVAQRSYGGIGHPGMPLAINLERPLAAPVVLSEFSFVKRDEPALVQWEAPENAVVDHYNVYRFEDSAAAFARYERFYDEGYYRTIIAPKDSFRVNEKTYYYYAMEPLAQLEAGITSLSDSTYEGRMVYVITAVDAHGFESAFSRPITIESIADRSRDILVITYSTSEETSNVKYDSLVSFYSDVLSGRDFDIYNHRDSTSSTGCPNSPHFCIDWNDFIPYRLIIIDDGTSDLIMADWYEDAAGGYERYLLSGGQLVYFGPLSGFSQFVMSSPPAFYPVTHPFLHRFFAIDSLFYMGAGHYALTATEPYIDSLLGFNRAEAIIDGYPDLYFDSASNPLTGDLGPLWPDNTPPNVAAFKVRKDAEVIHRLRSLYPASSLVEGEAVGVRTSFGGITTHLFGFHLWYMERESARNLLDWIISDIPGIAAAVSPATLPDRVLLHQNYPNPFNPSTTIVFELPTPSYVTLDIFNILGQRVATLINETRPAGSYEVEWDGRNSQQGPVASGVYLYRLRTAATTQTRKMLLLR